MVFFKHIQVTERAADAVLCQTKQLGRQAGTFLWTNDSTYWYTHTQIPIMSEYKMRLLPKHCFKNII